MEGKVVYSVTTMVAKDEYTTEYINRRRLMDDSMCREIKVGVSPVRIGGAKE